MADVRALPGLRYDLDRAGSPIEALVAPPYDVLSETEVRAYAGRSPYNAVHLTRPGTDYDGAARRFSEWRESGVVREDAPSMYVHEVRFTHAGREATRRDLVAALRLQPYEDRVVLPHERTHRGPKEDRLALFRATHAALEPLWFLYDGASVSLPEFPTRKPDLEFEFPEGERHRWWSVADAGFHAAVHRALSPHSVLIADGHHRYETTLAFSQELGGPEDAASRFTLALLTDLRDPGLLVLPTHRLLRAGVAVTGGEEVSTLTEMLGALEDGVRAGTYRDGVFQVLDLEGEVPVVELHRQVIDNILGRRTAEEVLYYTRDPEEAVAEVSSGRAVAAFFLGPPDLALVLRKAAEGMTFPQKTTYFHPKPPTGLVYHRLDSRPLAK